MLNYEYKLAFSRTLGWITTEEQDLLRSKTVAIAGCGGVGGHYCEVLARLGVEKFHIADFDHFELQNFNRQNQALIPNIGKSKVAVIKQLILDINPNASVVVFAEGIHKNNIGNFIEGVDLYLDGLDFFELTLREMLFNQLAQRQIPAVTLAPIGMGTGFVAFDKESMSFQSYFGFNKCKSSVEKALHFLIGMSPHMLSQKYVVDKSKVDFVKQKVISCPMGVYMCASIAGTMAIKILLDRKQIKYAPWNYEIDGYAIKLKKTYLWWGYKNPMFQIKKFLIKILLKIK